MLTAVALVHVLRVAAVIKVDHGRAIAFDEQVRETQVVVGQPKPIPAAPVGIEPTAEHVFQAAQKRKLLSPDTEAILPAAGATLRANKRIAIPCRTCEASWPTP